MLKAQITTRYERFEVDLPDYQDKRAAYETVKHAIFNSVLETETTLIDIQDPGRDLVSIKIIQAEKGNAVEQEQERRKPAAAQGDGLYKFNAVGFEFLGTTIDVSGLVAVHEGHSYYLPIVVNERPAQDALGYKNLVELIKLYGLSEGLLETDFTPVVPQDALPDLDEAAAYLSDYVKEVKKAQGGHKPKEKNARAYVDWNKNE